MKHKLFSWLFTLLAVSLTITFTSCGNDEPDEPDSKAPAFIGVWMYEYEEGLGNVYNIQADGTYIGYEDYEIKTGDYDERWIGRWIYDEDKKTLTFFEGDGDLEMIIKIDVISGNNMSVREWRSIWDNGVEINGHWGESHLWRRLGKDEAPQK